jgi:hypothetical protein
MEDEKYTRRFSASDVTIADIKGLHSAQQFAEQAQRLSGKFEIPTLEEVIALARASQRRRPAPSSIIQTPRTGLPSGTRPAAR